MTTRLVQRDALGPPRRRLVAALARRARDRRCVGSGRPGARLRRAERRRRQDARGARRGRPARDGEHHEADDRPRRARASLARRPVTVPAAAARIGESSIGLRAGQRVPVRDLVIGALVPSANDAATALAIAAGGNVPRFVAAMNRKAEALGLTRTRYRNPHGLDEAGHVSTAADSAALLRAALRVPVIRRYVGMDRATLSDGRVVESTDNLLGTVPGFAGGKTGHTALAGWSQVGFARFRGVGHHRRGARLADRGAARSRPRRAAPLRPRELPALARRRREPDVRRVAVGWGREPLALVAPRTIVRPSPTGRPLVERVVAPPSRRCPSAPVSDSARSSSRDGSRVVARSPLVASRAEPEPTLAQKARWVAGRIRRPSRGARARDRHRHPQRRARPVADRPDPPARPAPPRERRADARRRQGHQRRAGAQAARPARWSRPVSPGVARGRGSSRS